MSDVVRYRGMEPSQEGAWVRFCDYAALQFRLAEVEAERDDAVIKRAAWELATKTATARVKKLEKFLDRATELAEEYDTQMDVDVNPCGAWKAIQELYQGIALAAMEKRKADE